MDELRTRRRTALTVLVVLLSASPIHLAARAVRPGSASVTDAPLADLVRDVPSKTGAFLTGAGLLGVVVLLAVAALLVAFFLLRRMRR